MPPAAHAEMQHFMRRKPPFSLLVEYLSAAIYPADGQPSRESIAERETRREQDSPDISLAELTTRSAYMGAYGIFSAALPVALARGASLTHLSDYAQPINQAADWVASSIMDWASRLGVMEGDMVQFAGENAPLMLSGVLLVAAGASWFTRRLASSNLADKVAKPSVGVAEELFGFAGNKDTITTRLAALSQGERHLLRHLNPHELRVFLAGDADNARAILAFRKIGFSQKMDAAATDKGYLEFVGNMMGLALPAWVIQQLGSLPLLKDKEAFLPVWSEERLVGRLFARRQEEKISIGQPAASLTRAAFGGS